jgi:hypothetical protein
MPPEPPYGIIWRGLREGKVIPFLGAGASLSGRPPQTEGDEKSGALLPTGRELAGWLADDCSFPSNQESDRADLAKVASYYQESGDRLSLINFLHEVFCKEYDPGHVHQFLADLQMPLLIVTTNYDSLIERAFEAKGKPYHLVVHPTDRKDLAASVLWWKPGDAEPKAYPPQSLPLSLTDTTIIYKMHGSVYRQTKTWDSFVITEEDYVEFLARMIAQSAIPRRFLLHFLTCHFLFLGYGLNDWNLRVMLRNLKTTLVSSETEAPEDRSDAPSADKGVRSWAVQHRPSELEQTLWEARRVRIYDMDIDVFVDKMRAHGLRSEQPA